MFARSSTRLAEAALGRFAALQQTVQAQHALSTLAAAPSTARPCLAALAATTLPSHGITAGFASTWSGTSASVLTSIAAPFLPSQPFSFAAHFSQQAQPQEAKPQQAAQQPRAVPEEERSIDPEVLGDNAKTFEGGYIAPHRGIQVPYASHPGGVCASHPGYTKDYVEGVAPTHKPPQLLRERVGYRLCQFTRTAFDYFTGYSHDKMTEQKFLRRFLFLETVAGVPGMVGGMLRHLQSLRLMRRDNGWIHTLLEEAENERMHLLTFLQLRQPGILFRGMVLVAQGVFCNVYFLSYLLAPRVCHSFVGYLEEEAVRTYTHAIKDLEAGKLPQWTNLAAPDIAIAYWRLNKDAKMRDVLLAVRADEACHSHVNHTFSAIKPTEANPFTSHQSGIPEA